MDGFAFIQQTRPLFGSEGSCAGRRCPGIYKDNRQSREFARALSKDFGSLAWPRLRNQPSVDRTSVDAMGRRIALPMGGGRCGVRAWPASQERQGWVMPVPSHRAGCSSCGAVHDVCSVRIHKDFQSPLRPSDHSVVQRESGRGSE
jgi:hypothetical protein